MQFCAISGGNIQAISFPQTLNRQILLFSKSGFFMQKGMHTGSIFTKCYILVNCIDIIRLAKQR
jgi:hypothetical protein